MSPVVGRWTWRYRERWTSAEVLHARKREGSLSAVRARRQEYLDLVEMLPAAAVTVIDVTRGEDEVLADLLRIARGPDRAG